MSERPRQVQIPAEVTSALRKRRRLLPLWYVGPLEVVPAETSEAPIEDPEASPAASEDSENN